MRPVAPSVLQDILFLAFVAGHFQLCETPRKIEKRLYGRTPCWEQQMATMLSGWEKQADLEWIDQEVTYAKVGGCVDASQG